VAFFFSVSPALSIGGAPDRAAGPREVYPTGARSLDYIRFHTNSSSPTSNPQGCSFVFTSHTPLFFSSACCGSRAPGAISYHRSRRSFFPPLSAMSCVTHFPDADSFQRQSDEFIAWLAQRPGVRISPKIRVADLRSQGAGRGVGMFFLSVFNFPLSAFLRSFSLLRPWTPLIRSKQSLAPTSSTVRNYSPSPATWSSPSGIPSSRT